MQGDISTRADQNFERELPLKEIVEMVSGIRDSICGPHIRLSKSDIALHGYEELLRTGLLDYRTK
ncbi:hypothetical protein AT5A_19976 [Agrobacterium tumefaciens 5A]|nr:hypothetical protein AT5A_19976 [Agrobacterium tumefaciens 5A]